MRHIYKRKTYFLPTNNIIDVKLNDKVIELNGTFFNAIGQIIELEDILEINFIVRTNMQLKVIGIIVLILLGGVLLSENVTINGNVDQYLWKG